MSERNDEKARDVIRKIFPEHVKERNKIEE